jgi:hypothetical protein
MWRLIAIAMVITKFCWRLYRRLRLKAALVHGGERTERCSGFLVFRRRGRTCTLRIVR